jgi:hypothetical protein
MQKQFLGDSFHCGHYDSSWFLIYEEATGSFLIEEGRSTPPSCYLCPGECPTCSTREIPWDQAEHELPAEIYSKAMEERTRIEKADPCGAAIRPLD